MTKLKLTAIGTSIGVVPPEAILARLNVEKGDHLHAVEPPDGGFSLTPVDPELAAKMVRADDMMRRHHNTLDALAK